MKPDETWQLWEHKTKGYIYWARLHPDTMEYELRYTYPVGFNPPEDGHLYEPHQGTVAGRMSAKGFTRHYRRAREGAPA